MDVTNRFVLDFVKRFAADHPGAKALDFGCGDGAVVTAGREAGIDVLGADVFYGGSDSRAAAERSGLLGTLVNEIQDGVLPFDSGFFDLVTNNQVLEHVEDLDANLREISRVMKSGAILLSIFPARDVFREGHIGVPFSHWFPKGSRTRFYYTWALRALGAGTWKEQAPTYSDWARDKLRWIDTYTHYRSRKEIFSVFQRYFTSELREPDYIRYRLKDSPRLAPFARLLGVPGAPSAASAVFRKLAFLVIVSRKLGL